MNFPQEPVSSALDGEPDRGLFPSLERSSADHDPAGRLRELGLSVTAQRLAVMRCVRANPHATAETIDSAVRSELGAISRQAVYDTLGLLTERGVLRRIQPARSAARYEDRVNDNHHHVVCRTCGVTQDVDCAVGNRPCLKASDSRGFLIDEAEVIYWGLCGDCVASEPASEHDG